MKPSSNKRRVLLVGAGHANLEFIKSWRASDHALAEFTLITPHSHALYSGLLPAYLRGEVGLNDLQIDLQALAQRRGFRLHLGKMRSLSVEYRQIVLADGACMEFDDLMINMGGQTPSAWQGVSSRCLHVRPLSQFIDVWERDSAKFQRIAVIGAGAAGIEIAASLAGTPTTRGPRTVHLFEKSSDLGVSTPKKVRKQLRDSLSDLGVDLHFNANFVGLPRSPDLALGSKRWAFDLVLATIPTTPPSCRIDGVEQLLQTNTQFRLIVDSSGSKTSSAVAATGVWVTGDAIAGGTWPRSGVSAVRQGQRLRRLWLESLNQLDQDPRAGNSFRPQLRQLKLLRVGAQVSGLWDRYYLGRSRLLLWLKRWIDRRYVRSFKS
jgi:NADH dehydrogenase FAD-containing subunit